MARENADVIVRLLDGPKDWPITIMWLVNATVTLAFILSYKARPVDSEGLRLVYLTLQHILTYMWLDNSSNITNHYWTQPGPPLANLWPHAKLYDEALCVASVDGGTGGTGC